MENDDCINIEAVGFDIIPSEMGHINRQINDLYQLCPIDAIINLIFNKNFESFDGALIVESSVKTFSAKLSGSDIQSLYRNLDQEIQEQLIIWKKDRFK